MKIVATQVPFGKDIVDARAKTGFEVEAHREVGHAKNVGGSIQEIQLVGIAIKNQGITTVDATIRRIAFDVTGIGDIDVTKIRGDDGGGIDQGTIVEGEVGFQPLLGDLCL